MRLASSLVPGTSFSSLTRLELFPAKSDRTLSRCAMAISLSAFARLDVCFSISSCSLQTCISRLSDSISSMFDRDEV